jgi:hypothetical protein
LPKSKIGQAIGYVMSRWDHLRCYVSDGRFEIDNNLVENAIRPISFSVDLLIFLYIPDSIAGKTNFCCPRRAGSARPRRPAGGVRHRTDTFQFPSVFFLSQIPVSQP